MTEQVKWFSSACQSLWKYLSHSITALGSRAGCCSVCSWTFRLPQSLNWKKVRKIVKCIQLYCSCIFLSAIYHRIRYKIEIFFAWTLIWTQISKYFSQVVFVITYHMVNNDISVHYKHTKLGSATNVVFVVGCNLV